MTDVELGRAGDDVDVDLDVCAKTGRTTTDRVTLRGSTVPGWVLVLLLLTVVGFVLAVLATSRRSQVTLPLVHAAYRRWKRLQLVAWLVGACGLAAVVVAVGTGDRSGVFGAVGIALVAGALVGDTAATATHGLTLRRRRGALVLRGAGPEFAAAVAAARVEVARP